jgi:hypothetical protein
MGMVHIVKQFGGRKAQAQLPKKNGEKWGGCFLRIKSVGGWRRAGFTAAEMEARWH